MTETQVMLYVPNLIGYARFAFLVSSSYFAFSENYWLLYPVCYGLASLLDAADGMAARALN